MPTDPPPPAEMTSWFTHTATGLIGAGFVFLLKLRGLMGSEQSNMLAKALARIDVLEQRVDAMQAHLIAAAATNATLVQQVTDLSADLAESRRREAQLQAEIDKLKGK